MVTHYAFRPLEVGHSHAVLSHRHTPHGALNRNMYVELADHHSVKIFKSLLIFINRN
jgi:hypothetical protein